MTIYIDPRNPEKSVLQHNGLVIPVLETIAGILLLSLWARAVVREKREKARATAV